jgi:anti-sigma factor RsiW
MSTLQHPHAELSAYADGALPAAEQAAVGAHVESCGQCSARVSELRATAALIRALPSPVPARSLVPRLSQPVWLAPMRTLASLASGAFVLLFAASLILVNAPSGSTTALERAAQPATDAKGAAPTSAPSAFSVAGTATPVPAPLVPPAAQRGAAATADASKRLDVASPTSSAAADNIARTTSASEPRPQLPTPLIWLSLAVLSAAVAIVLQKRLRSPA